MKFNAPKKMTVLIALILVIVAVIFGRFVMVSAITPYALWISVAGFAVLLFGNTTKGF
jgi:hypothetical protein